MSVLALDLGTTTGFALLHPTGLVMSGSWSLKSKRMESVGMRYVRFREHLDMMKTNNGVRQVYFEEVRRHMGVDAAHMYGGYLSHLQAWCCEHEIEWQGVPVGQIKLFWTGNGRASKEMMIAEARRRGYDPCDDNEADAIAILVLKTEGKS
jgi:Holliday junction resolvasome RuvABC endonuclease subunit